MRRGADRPTRLPLTSTKRLGVLFLSCLAVHVTTSDVRAAAEGRRPDLRHFKSHYVSYSWPHFSTTTTLWARDPEPGESPVRPRINMNLTNKSSRAFWLVVTLTPPSPYTGRTGVAHLEPNQTVEFESTQDSILAEADYLIDLMVLADSALTDTLEAGRTRVWFDRGNVERLEQRLLVERCQHALEHEPVALPRTFEHIVVRKEMGLLTSLTGRMGGSGTMVVGLDGLQHATKKDTVALSAAQLRSVSRKTADGSDDSMPWVVVEYEDGGETRELWLIPAAFSAPGEMEDCIELQMHAAIDALIARRNESRR